MLIEAVIASTVVITAMVGLYSSIQRIYNKYQSRDDFFSVDAMYASSETVRYLMDNGNLNHVMNLLAKNDNDETNSESQVYLIKENICNNISDDSEFQDGYWSDFCGILQELYGVKNMIIADYDKNVIEKLPETATQFNETFREYIEFLIGYYNIKEDNVGVSDESEVYQYIVLTELEEEGRTKYASMVIR